VTEYQKEERQKQIPYTVTEYRTEQKQQPYYVTIQEPHQKQFFSEYGQCIRANTCSR